jgi:APA family basic amino acid/polyamine antiporter
MSAAAIFILRKRAPGASRPYSAWGYPFTPAVFIAFALFLVVYSIIENPRDSLIGAGIVLAGIPAYMYWRKR